ncbi:hypothetical protein DIS24_g2832 [Lasiodiplodia hormozganensis]|uniref:Magnesium transport protein CorA n=1 Tax=Lasiodiplodia hormozganensis TaxID=869390 RepID=A0AA40D5D6_9PEZI|nr:hypothetical protein DIS24_g2832 [Lasiodiplodia hormozganensis]
MLVSEFDLLTTVFYACSTGNRLMVCCKSQLASKGVLKWVLRQLSYAASLSYCSRTNTVKGIVLADPASLDKLANSCLEFKPLVHLRKKYNAKTLELEQRIGLRRDWTADENFLNQTEMAMRETLERLTMITNYKADTEMMDKNFMGTIASSIELVSQQIPSITGSASRERMERQSLDFEYLAEYLRQSNSSIAASLGALQKRVEIQMSALYTLIGQRDSKLNLEMAHDSRRLASASKRDSSSMKTIAVLTTVFLPGTFIATVFGMPMVEYKSAQFWIYLAIAIPLTVVVMIIWATWMLWIERRNEREDKKAQERLPIYNNSEEDGLDNHPALRRMKRVLCQE